MPTNQKYSTRVHSIRQLKSASEHVRAASIILLEVGLRYKEALPQVSLGCEKLNDMVVMSDAMITDIRDNI